MKFNRGKSVATALAIVGLTALTGCGKSSTPVTGGPVGYIPPQQLLPGGGIAGQCMPISAQIGFTGTGIYVDSASIRGGAIPGTQTMGQMNVTTVGAGGPFQRSGVDGTISMNVMLNNAAQPTVPGYPTGGYWPTPMTPTTANVTGFIAINPQTQQDIIYKFGGTTGYYPTYPTYPTYPGTLPVPTTPTQQVCVSGIAIDTGHKETQLFNIRVFLYLNNSQHGYIIYP
ncbi:MAG: hypothetical protein A2X94_07555 [Bdellovibrionales bacterium GWB1_55_8]|nr:MAG: hypothetical protein A2X94_07555 [Bdellovibrionales bacterium GWB1_55_8]